MRFKHQQAGFTLIEILLTLSIGSLLAVLLFNQYSATQARSRFTTSVEQTAATIERVQSEVAASYTTSNNGANDHSPRTIFFGKAIIFAANSSIIQIHSLTNDDNGDGSVANHIQDKSTTNSLIPWGATPTNINNIVIFIKNPADNSTVMYTMPANGDITQFAQYRTDKADIEIKSADGNQSARVCVNPANLQVIRDYNDHPLCVTGN